MKLIYAPESFPNTDESSIFLAGPTPRSKDVQSWRNEALCLLDQIGFTGFVFIPEPRNGEFTHAYDDQIEWELEGLRRASVIVFWIPRNLVDMPAFTTNVEFGSWIHSGKVAFGSPPNTEKMNYLIYLAGKYNVSHNASLLDTLTHAISKIDRVENANVNIWFTADTHFGSERTLYYSQRPFNSVYEMDQAMINNWNSKVKMQDVVYHLGDFGDYNIVKQLNGRIVLLLGNYERKDIEENKISLGELQDLFEKVYESPMVIRDPINCMLRHEPTNRNVEDFTLFGHIHKLQMVKKNALNVGVDCHHFYPIDINTIKFYKDAIQNHYDNDVFVA